MKHESDDLHSHAVVEPRQRNDSDDERWETEANDHENGYSDDGCPDQILGNLLWCSQYT